MENYFRKKKIRNNFKIVSIILIAIISLDYFYLKSSLDEMLSPIIIVINIFGIFVSWNLLEIKLPKRKLTIEVIKETEMLKAMLLDEAGILFKNDNENIDKRNSVCPLCRNIKIVNKISETKGAISGSFQLGFGSVSGDIETDTVNHCSDCGHEWSKGTSSYSKNLDDAMEKIVTPMYIFFEKGTNKEDDILKTFSAESVKVFFEENTLRDAYYFSYLKKLSKSEIKKYTGK